MVIGAVAIVLADVVVAIEAIALVALRADGVRAATGPVSAANVMWYGGIASVVMFEMHSDTPGSVGQKAYRRKAFPCEASAKNLTFLQFGEDFFHLLRLPVSRVVVERRERA